MYYLPWHLHACWCPSQYQGKSVLVYEQHRSPLAKLPVDVAMGKQKVRCCCVKRCARTGRLGYKDTSLNLFLTAWSDTVTPVTLLRSCCSSLAVAKYIGQCTDGQISVILWGCHASTTLTLSNSPCELTCLIVEIPQAVNNWQRDIKIHSNKMKSLSFLDQSDCPCDLNLVKTSHGMYNMLKWPQ